jgi:hypothetical protein
MRDTGVYRGGLRLNCCRTCVHDPLPLCSGQRPGGTTDAPTLLRHDGYSNSSEIAGTDPSEAPLESVLKEGAVEVPV